MDGPELSFGSADLDVELGAALAGWLPDCSSLDALLGAAPPGGVFNDAPKAPPQLAQPSPPQPATRWQGFPSALFPGGSSSEFGASFDLPDLSGTPPPRKQAQPPASLTPQASLPLGPGSPFAWHVGSPSTEPSPSGSLRGEAECASPAKSESGETQGACNVPAAKPAAAAGAGSPARAGSWQRGGGVLKRCGSGKARPKLRAQTAQVAELKGQVAQLTARCQAMQEARGSSPHQLPLLAAPALLPHGTAPLPAAPPAPGPLAELQGASVARPPGCAAGAAAGAGGAGQPPPLQGVTAQQFGTLYRSAVSRVAVRLGTLPKQENAPELGELRRCAGEVLLLVMSCCMTNSVVAKLWLREGHQAGQDGGKQIASLVQSLALSGDQEQAIVQLRTAFLERLEGVRAARREILAGLSGAGEPSRVRNCASAVAQLGALQGVESFVANVKAADRCICDFVSCLLSQVLCPLQLARCLVAAYPHWPDTLAISTYVAAAAGEAAALGLLQQEFGSVSIAASS